MAGETTLTLVGNLTADPEMRFTSAGAAVASFTVASTPRTYDRNSGEWRDGDTLFVRCSVWRDAAEHVAESLTKGTRVIVTGRLTQRSYTARDGSERTSLELQVDEVGPSLRYAKAQVTRMSRGGGQQQGGGNFGGGAPAQQQPQGGYNAPGGYGGGQVNGGYNAPAGGAANDPWATGGDTSFGDEPPF